MLVPRRFFTSASRSSRPNLSADIPPETTHTTRSDAHVCEARSFPAQL
jgi:hypothetical protein